MATFDAAQLILFNFEELSLNWLRMSFNARECQTLHNTAATGPLWPHFVHSEARLNTFGLKWHIMVQRMFYWRDMINSGYICISIACFEQFQSFRASLITLLSRCRVSLNWPEMVRNNTTCLVVARYVHL